MINSDKIKVAELLKLRITRSHESGDGCFICHALNFIAKQTTMPDEEKVDYIFELHSFAEEQTSLPVHRFQEGGVMYAWFGSDDLTSRLNLLDRFIKHLKTKKDGK